MTRSLRQRRRQEAARDIQNSTLELAVTHDLDNVKTKEIAAVTGISTRTFFNYYTNKEAAAIGHMQTLAGDEAILRMVGKVLRSNEKARGILYGFLRSERHALTDCLNTRAGSRQTSAALASCATDAIRRAIFLWEHADDMSLQEALDDVWRGTIDASRLLIEPSR